MVKRNSAKVTTENKAESTPNIEIQEDPITDIQARAPICVVKCRLRKIQFIDTDDWPENLRGKIWCEGQVKTIPKATYLKLDALYPSKFELIRED